MTESGGELARNNMAVQISRLKWKLRVGGGSYPCCEGALLPPPSFACHMARESAAEGRANGGTAEMMLQRQSRESSLLETSLRLLRTCGTMMKPEVTADALLVWQGTGRWACRTRSDTLVDFALRAKTAHAARSSSCANRVQEGAQREIVHLLPGNDEEPLLRYRSSVRASSTSTEPHPRSISSRSPAITNTAWTA